MTLEVSIRMHFNSGELRWAVTNTKFLELISRATPSTEGPHSREEGFVVAVLCWLSCLVFRCFEFFGFPVKCAEAGWRLEVSFHGIFTHSCYFGHRYCYFGVQSLSFGWPGRLGARWENIGAAGRTRAVRKQIFLVIRGWYREPVFRAFWFHIRTFKFMWLAGVVSRSLSASFC